MKAKLAASACHRAAAAAGVIVAGLGLGACSGTRPGTTRTTTTLSTTTSLGPVGSGPVGTLLDHVLPDARFITAVDLRSARAELGLSARAFPAMPRMPARRSGPAHGPPSPSPSRSGGPQQALARLSELVLPLSDDAALFSALDRGDIEAAVQFSGVDHGGLLIATAQPSAEIASALRRHGWSAVTTGGFQYRHTSAPGGEILAHSLRTLVPGGLAIAYQPGDARSMAGQTAPDAGDATLLRAIGESSAPARFSATTMGCIAGVQALERLVPRSATVTITLTTTPDASALLLGQELRGLRRAGISAGQPRIRGRQIELSVAYSSGAMAPVGTIISLARSEAVYRC